MFNYHIERDSYYLAASKVVHILFLSGIVRVMRGIIGYGIMAGLNRVERCRLGHLVRETGKTYT